MRHRASNRSGRAKGGDQNHRSSAPPIAQRPTRHSPIWHSKVACLTYRTRLPTWEVALRLLEQADGGKSAPRVRHHPSPPASDSSLAKPALESGMPHVPHSFADVGRILKTGRWWIVSTTMCDTTHPPASDRHSPDGNSKVLCLTPAIDCRRGRSAGPVPPLLVADGRANALLYSRQVMESRHLGVRHLICGANSFVTTRWGFAKVACLTSALIAKAEGQHLMSAPPTLSRAMLACEEVSP